MTRELPILFSPAMIRALPPRGPKSQTRRTRGLGEINETPDEWTVESTDAEAATLLNRVTGELREIRCPYGPTGTRLWVKEGWTASVYGNWVGIKYLATGDWYDRLIPDANWKQPQAAKRGKAVTSLFMPRWASRSTFVNTGWRIERVQEITEADCLREGLIRSPDGWWESVVFPPVERLSGIAVYQELWDHLNGKKLPWSRNGWVWVIGFEPEGGAK